MSFYCVHNLSPIGVDDGFFVISNDIVTGWYGGRYGDNDIDELVE